MRGDMSHPTGLTPSAHHEHDLLHPILWPFRVKGEWSRTWWLLFVNYIPLINFLVLRGWRLAVVRHMARRESPIAPSFLSILRLAGNGLLLWTMTGAYALLPLVIIAHLGLGGFDDFIRDLVEVARILIGRSDQDFWTFVGNELLDSLWSVMIELLWIPLSAPLYRSAMIRFAVTGNLAEFGNFPGIISFLVRNLGAFIRLYLFSFLLGGVIAVGGGILMLTGIGALVVPLVTFPLYYWSTAFEYGELAQKLAAERAERGIVERTPSALKQAFAATGLVCALLAYGVHSVLTTVNSASTQIADMLGN